MEATQKPFTRKKPDQLVYLELGSGNGGMLLSISDDGFRFRAVSPLRPNGLMPFAFSFDGSQRLQGIGEVEWLEEDGKSGGMRFVEVSADFRSALGHWLAQDSPREKSSREVTPVASTPLDTMEKIREELRRGYPQPPAKATAASESQVAPSTSLAPEHEAAVKESSFEPQAQQSNAAREAAGHPQSGIAETKSKEQRSGQTAARKQEHTHSPNPAPAPTEQRKHAPAKPDRPNADRRRPFEQRAKPIYPPPFTHPAEEEESPAVAEKTNSAFLKRPVPPSVPSPTPAGSTVPRPDFGTSQASAPVSSEVSQSREEAHASAETLRRPFRPEPRSAHSDRPYIPPPIDESFESAWERAKLTTPPESPHLSRAAAGSIIGIALAVILGALVFNFRRDIGELVIDLGQKISGGNHPAAPEPPGPASQNSESQTPANSNSSTLPVSPDKPDAAGAQAPPMQNSGGASGAAGTRTAESASQHDVPAGTARDANSNPSRQSVSSGTPSTPGSNPNPAASGVTASTGAASVPTGNTAALIGTEPGSGQEEFNAARELLRGDHRHRDLSQAVNLLWAGVRKGYVPAEVTLADLYRRGDGVEKNCDQAQVLLVAASKKGSPEARQMLELMAEQGCSE